MKARFYVLSIRHKTKADFATIKQFCRPITPTSQNERVKNYEEDHFAYAVFDGLNVRIFRPYLKSQGFQSLWLVRSYARE